MNQLMFIFVDSWRLNRCSSPSCLLRLPFLYWLAIFQRMELRFGSYLTLMRWFHFLGFSVYGCHYRHHFEKLDIWNVCSLFLFYFIFYVVTQRYWYDKWNWNHSYDCAAPLLMFLMETLFFLSLLPSSSSILIPFGRLDRSEFFEIKIQKFQCFI